MVQFEPGPTNPKIKKINIKKDFPPSDVAVYDLSVAIKDCKQLGVEVLKVIHGYGSHGIGGDIKRAVIRYLYKCKRKKEIEFFVQGEEWSSFDERVKYLEHRFPEFIIDGDLKNLNSGITVIYIQKTT